MNFKEIVKYLENKVGDKILLEDGKDAIYLKTDIWSDVSQLLKNDTDLSFDYLMCISSYDKGDNKTFGVAYNFYSNEKSHYLEVRIEVEDGVSIPSVSSLWRTADWHEREAFDLMGIYFIGHPDLRRVLLPEGFAGHPLRKDYVYEIHEEEW